MNDFTVLNKIILFGNAQEPIPSSSNENKSTLTIPPSSSVYSSYLNEGKTLIKPIEKIISQVPSYDISVKCAFDFWIWIEAQNYFTIPSLTSSNLSVLELKGTINIKSFPY